MFAVSSAYQLDDWNAEEVSERVPTEMGASFTSGNSPTLKSG